MDQIITVIDDPIGYRIADNYREHWIQRITFAAETNAAEWADTHTA